MLLLVLGLAMNAGSASAAFLHSTSSGSFGPDGTAGTYFITTNKGNLATGFSDRHLYAVQSDGEFSDEGLDLHGFDIANPFQPLGGLFPVQVLFGSDRGALDGNAPQGIAVDNSGLASDGNVYVLANYGSSTYATQLGKMYGYSSNGENLGGSFPQSIVPPKEPCAIAVDAEGHVWLADERGKKLDEYSSAGADLERSIPLKGLALPCSFVFDSATNDVYVAGRVGESPAVWKYSADSDYKSVTEVIPANGGFGGASLAFDAQHRVLYAMGGNVKAFNTDGVLIDEFGPGGNFMALDEPTGTIYVSAPDAYPNGQIHVFPPSGVVPDATTEGVTGNTVHATVDPVGGGDITECEFEYDTSTLYTESEPCDQLLPYPTAQGATASLPGLTNEVLYHYRVRVGNADGDHIAAARTFVPHFVTDLKTQPATDQTRTTATLTASYTGTTKDTHFYFKWGPDTSYGNLTAAPPGTDDGTVTGPRTMSAPIGGLVAGTTYHYQVIASNADGVSVGEDRTFSTLPSVADLAGTITNLTGDSVTLNANWTGDGSSTHYYFEWGATKVYGNTTPESDGGSGTGPQHFTVDLSALSPTSNYHFRLIATNAFGMTVTADGTFRTPQLAAVAYRSVANIDNTTAELRGTVNPRKTGPTTFHFEYGVDQSYGLNTPESAPLSSDEVAHDAAAKLEGLEVGRLYHYRLVATSPTGVARGSDQKFRTIPYLPTVESSSRSNLVVGGVILHAIVRPGLGATIVYFQYGPSDQYGSETIPTEALPGDNGHHEVSATLSALSPSTVYHYRAVAVNYAGVATGPDGTFETPGLPRVGAVAVTNIGANAATLVGQVEPHLTDTTYHFEYGPTLGYGFSTPESSSVGADGVLHEVHAVVGGLNSGLTYHVRLVATNALGSGNSTDQIFTTIASSSSRPPITCRKNQIRRQGKCVRKRPKRHHRRHHHRRRAD
jgi:hypothetical protein